VLAACGRSDVPEVTTSPVPAVLEPPAPLGPERTRAVDLVASDQPVGGLVAKAGGGKGEAPVGFGDKANDNDDGRKLIRTGRVELVVAGFDDARTKIEALVAGLGGYVDSTQVDRRQDAVTDATIVVRIPARTMPGLVPKLREIGEVVSESTNAADITDEYIDLSARLASDQALEKRLLELAADHNGNIDQVLAVERELARVREEIEGYQGHLRQWNDQIAMSTLTLSISTRRPEIAAATSPSFGERARRTWDSSIDALEDGGEWLVIHAFASLPWLLVIIPCGLVLRRLARRIWLPFVILRRKKEGQ
jgi:hypothetical protein